MSPSDLAEALALLPVSEDCGIVELDGFAPDVLAFETGAPHAGADPLDDQASLKLGYGADDHHDGPAQGASRVDVLPNRRQTVLSPEELSVATKSPKALGDSGSVRASRLVARFPSNLRRNHRLPFALMGASSSFVSLCGGKRAGGAAERSDFALALMGVGMPAARTNSG
jgi:hypothetical protein